MLKTQQKRISLEEAQTLVLKAQGLIQSSFLTGKEGALSIISQLGYLQIDTLNVVARSHHHTLWTRLPDYKEDFLYQLLEADKHIFEYWSHAASYLPMNDYRFSLPVKRLYANGKAHWFAQNKKMSKYVLDRIKAEGPLQSKDFEFKRSTPGNWYNWKPAKQALEQLFMEGRLMVAKRQNFQKVYDLTERVLLPTTDVSVPTQAEFASYLIKRAIQSNGLVSENEVSYLRKGVKKEAIAKEIKRMVKTGEVEPLNVETIDTTYFTFPSVLQTLRKGVQTYVPESGIHFLSPFDNAVIQRKRLNNLFGFDYCIECYLPESKRKYGYLCLPVLYNNKFVARIDPKADRSSKTFYIKSIHFEKGFMKDEAFNEAFTKKIKAFSRFNSCNKIVVKKAEKPWKKEITSKL